MPPQYGAPTPPMPTDFDGVFRFTNPSDEPITCKWNNIGYTFAANSTSPMLISNATPEEVQHIRKKFARELATREFYKSLKFKSLDAQSPAGSGNTAAIYSEEDIAPYVQKCLEPLAPARAVATPLPKQTADSFRKDPDGSNVTVPLDKGASLVRNGASVMTD